MLFVPTASSITAFRLIGARRANATEIKAYESSKPAPDLEDDLAPRPLDLSKGVRGKYYDRMQAGTNIILLAPDLLDTFPDSYSVNEALRSLKKIATRTSAPRLKTRKAAHS